MALRLWGLATAGALVIGTTLLHSSARTVQAAPSPPEPCGTLDLSNPLTQHCENLLFHNTYLNCASECQHLNLLALFPFNSRYTVPDTRQICCAGFPADGEKSGTPYIGISKFV